MRLPRPRPLRLRGAVLVAVAAAGLGCGGGSSPTEPPPPPPPLTPLTVTFVGEHAGEADAVVIVPVGEVGPGIFAVEIRGHELAPLQGVFFDLLYPPELLTYFGFYEGSFLSVGSVGQPGRIPGRLRCNLVKYESGAVASGSGTMLRFLFTGRAPGEGRLVFEGYGILDPDTGEMRYGERNWFGATAAVER